MDNEVPDLKTLATWHRQSQILWTASQLVQILMEAIFLEYSILVAAIASNPEVCTRYGILYVKVAFRLTY